MADQARCAVWLARPSDVNPRGLRLLSTIEQGRRRRLVLVEDQDRFAAAAILLRLAAGLELDRPAHALRIDRTCDGCGQPHGKPRVRDSPLHVSVSHSGDLVAVALTTAAAVGVDVEQIGARDTRLLAGAVLAPGERYDGHHEFFRSWCRKEAVMKATGDGLRVAPREVLVGSATAPPRLESYAGRPLACSLHDLHVPPGYAGALATLTRGETLADVRDGSHLLAAA